MVLAFFQKMELNQAPKNMHTCTHTNTHIHAHMHAHTHSHTHIHTLTYTHACVSGKCKGVLLCWFHTHINYSSSQSD